MVQWPPHSDPARIEALARSWLATMPAAEIAELCARGLTPATTDGFTVFWSRGKPTALVCTPDDLPGSVAIAPARLTAIALACLWLGMPPLAMASFCRRGVVQYGAGSPFWCGVAAALSFAVQPSPSLYAAALGGTPWRRGFVAAAGARLHARGSGTAIDALLALAVGRPWTSTRDAAWPAAVSRWISEHRLEYAVHRTAMPSSATVAFSIYGVHIELVHRRDVVFIFLLCLFCADALGWGERVPTAGELPSPVAYAFSRHTFVHRPQPAPVHRLLAGLSSASA